MKKLLTAISASLLAVCQVSAAASDVQNFNIPVTHAAGANTLCVQINASGNHSFSVTHQEAMDSFIFGYKELPAETHSISSSKPYVHCISIDLVNQLAVYNAYYNILSINGNPVSDCRVKLSADQLVAKTYHFTIAHENGRDVCQFEG